MSTRSLIGLFAAAFLISTLVACQGEDAPGNSPNQSGDDTSSGAVTDPALYQQDVRGVDVCPEASELESLPLGVGFTVGMVPYDRERSDGRRYFSCDYGIYFESSERPVLEEDFIALSVGVTVYGEVVTATTEIDVDNSILAGFQEWENTAWEYDEGATDGSCFPGNGDLVTFNSSYYCADGAEPLAFSLASLTTSKSNVEFDFQASYTTPDSEVEGSDEELLGATMSDVASTILEAMPLAED